MNLFNRKQPQKSLADFKASAAAINSNEAINSITGGLLAACHGPGGMTASFSQLSAINTSALRVSAY